jgi:hypothetical protein
MPNGGSDCCGTCWFNQRTRARQEGAPNQTNIRDYCEVRQIEIERPFWTYCANHPHRSPEPDPIPVGPVWIGKDIQREVWKSSPDSEDIRAHLLELLSSIEEHPKPEYPMGVAKDEIIVWQIGEFRETRAESQLQRIALFDPEAATGTSGEPLHRSRKALVQLAIEVLGKIRG